jgi:exopolyphosphatase/guanosine-5'-triphosphate,3'-diphosphate pyrophosphatase
MRDAKNRVDIVRKIFLETGLNIEVISGDFEASLIYESHIAENLDTESNYLYVDVGGGSTELTFFNAGELIFKHSFNIGTIRLLKDLVHEVDWDFMKDTIKENIKGIKNTIAIGTGGNINKIFSMSKRKDGKPIQLELLKDYYKEFSSCSLEDRIRLYNLRSDRADVIVPALLIYIQVMKWASIDEMFVPKIGLADGLVQHLYADMIH